MAKSPYRIYSLTDPRSCEIYYVGQTKRALHDRMDEHFYESSDTLVSKKNQAIINSGQLPHITKLDTAETEEQAFHRELFWIHLLASQGRGLKNREAQKWFLSRYDEYFSGQGQKTSRTGSRKPPTAPKTIPTLQTETYDKVMAFSPTLDQNDVAELEGQWREWLNSPGKTHPRSPNAAFIAFCRKKLEG